MPGPGVCTAGQCSRLSRTQKNGKSKSWHEYIGILLNFMCIPCHMCGVRSLLTICTIWTFKMGNVCSVFTLYVYITYTLILCVIRLMYSRLRSHNIKLFFGYMPVVLPETSRDSAYTFRMCSSLTYVMLLYKRAVRSPRLLRRGKRFVTRYPSVLWIFPVHRIHGSRLIFNHAQ